MSTQQLYYTESPVYPLGGLLLFMVFIVAVVVMMSYFLPYTPATLWDSRYFAPNSIDRRETIDPSLVGPVALPPGQVPKSAAARALGSSYNPQWARGGAVGDGDMHQMLMSRITVDGFFKKV